MPNDKEVIINQLILAYREREKEGVPRWVVSRWRLMPIHRLRIELESYNGKA